MVYRTKTYLAGDWTGDSDAIEQLYKWNEGDRWNFHFVDVHSNKQCYDSSLPCTIKSSLRERMNMSKIFILVVGDNTTSTRKGSCAYQNCANKRYDFFRGFYECSVVGKAYNSQSFIDYECQLAYEAYKEDKIKIVVLYNAVSVDKSKCPEILKNIGIHIPMKCWKNGIVNRYTDWDYQSVKGSIM